MNTYTGYIFKIDGAITQVVEAENIHEAFLKITKTDFCESNLSEEYLHIYGGGETLVIRINKSYFDENVYYYTEVKYENSISN